MRDLNMKTKSALESDNVVGYKRQCYPMLVCSEKISNERQSRRPVF